MSCASEISTHGDHDSGEEWTLSHSLLDGSGLLGRFQSKDCFSRNRTSFGNKEDDDDS